MLSQVLADIRSASDNLKNCIVRSVEAYRARRLVIVNLISDKAFTQSDKENAATAVRRHVPAYFNCAVEIVKLSPDCEMVKNKIYEAVNSFSKAVFATLSPDDISVEKREGGFFYTIAVAPSFINEDLCEKINGFLKKCYCGGFLGECIASQINLEELETEEAQDEIEFEMPVRTFKIEDFQPLEGEKIQTTAVYLSDLNFSSEEVVICGTIEDIRERSYKNKNGIEKTYLSLTLNDTTASCYLTYFLRQKSAEKIKGLKLGDSIVCTGSNEEFKGELRYTAKIIDYGKIPQGFVPEKRESKPVPLYYHTVKPQPYIDAEQADFLTERIIPDCLKDKSFVVFDLETTGLNCSPVSGNMDRIIEIGAYKIVNGEIAESFSTFINPERRLSDEIIKLTGITEEMVANAPDYARVMPDFYKFCYGSILVGHNVVGFDYKFVDYYWSHLGYIFDRKLLDTIPLSQELLSGLSNYKLNTIAAKFNISFNHHRAVDDALATAKIFIELIKIKKSLPKLQ